MESNSIGNNQGYKFGVPGDLCGSCSVDNQMLAYSPMATAVENRHQIYLDPKDAKFGYGGNLNNMGYQYQHSPLAVGQMNFAPPGMSYNNFRQMMLVHPHNVNTMDHFAQYEGSLENAIFTDDVQAQMNSFFQRLYSHGLPVDQSVGILSSLRDSQHPMDKDLLMCIVKNLFDEYVFFAKEYPEKELSITAQLYGGLIRENVVSNINFALAVKKIIDALHSEPYQSLWRFGIIALNECRSCLHKYPKICQVLLSTPNFCRFPDDLKDFINFGVQGKVPEENEEILSCSIHQSAHATTPAPIPPATSSSMLDAKSANFVPKGIVPRLLPNPGSALLNVTNVDTLVLATKVEGKQVEAPPQVVFEQVSFIFNNLSESNVPNKANEVKEVIDQNGDNFLQWLAQYLVMKRVTVEQNYQPLYNNLLLLVKLNSLDAYVKKETLRNACIILRSNKNRPNSFGDRQILKNLGLWLGTITIARNIPILSKELDLKLLLLDAFYKGQQELLYVVPFVVKTILASKTSTVFKPKCSWISGIIKVLVELHNEPDLKLNLKFEIEVLCNSLGIDLRSVEVGTFLKDSHHEPKLILGERANSLVRIQDTSLLTSEANHVSMFGGLTLEPSLHPENSLSIAFKVLPPSVTLHYNDINIQDRDGLMQLLKEHQNLMLFQHYPHLKEISKSSILHAVQEIIGGISERSISIAMTVTEHICHKDFAVSMDEELLPQAYHQMVRAMTAAMAYLTCREPVADAMLSCIKQALHSHLSNTSGNSELAAMVDEAANGMVEMNLDLACRMIAKGACVKALAVVRSLLDKEFALRRTARQEGRIDLIDPEAASIMRKIPPQLRLKPSSEEDLKVYNDFSKDICGFKPLCAEEANKDFVQQALSYLPDGFVNGFESSTEKSTLHNPLNDVHGQEAKQSEFKTKTEAILRDWITICYTPWTQRDPLQALSSIFKVMKKQGISTLDAMSNFFKTCAEICFEVSHRLLVNDSFNSSSIVQRRCHYTLDAFVKLIVLMVKHSNIGDYSTKLGLLKEILGKVTTAVHSEHEIKRKEFNPMPFHRILINIFNELTSVDSLFDAAEKWYILEAFGQVLFVLQPRRVPGFAFHWLEIVGHRNFIGQLLAHNSGSAKASAMFSQLIIAHIKFMAPFLSNVKLPQSVEILYKGTLRLLLVILHDFPEVLCEYYCAFCDVIPPNCVQLRNVILSAYPKSMRLPDPFASSVELIASLPEMSASPRVHNEIFSIIPTDLRSKIDSFLEIRIQMPFVFDLTEFLQVPESSPTQYNVPLINTLIVYVGVHAIDSANRTQRNSSKTAAVAIFQSLVDHLCIKGRYLLFNALANQLRYPNTHTLFFSSAILHLFLKAESEDIREQITRILFERVVALRPHPWGLLVAFVELIRNDKYNFWKHEFVKCAPEIQRLFVSVASSCNVDFAGCLTFNEGLLEKTVSN